LEEAAALLQEGIVAQAKRDEEEATRSPEKHALSRAALLHFRADDPRLAAEDDGRVTLWPNRAGFSGDAATPVPGRAPVRATAKIGGHNKSVVRFDGQSVLQVSRSAPPTGTLFLVFQSSAKARAGERIVGWEDASVGKHGLGLMTDPGGRLH